MSRVDVTA